MQSRAAMAVAAATLAAANSLPSSPTSSSQNRWGFTLVVSYNTSLRIDI